MAQLIEGLCAQDAPDVLIGVARHDGKRDPTRMKPPQEVAHAHEEGDFARVAAHERARVVRDQRQFPGEHAEVQGSRMNLSLAVD